MLWDGTAYDVPYTGGKLGAGGRRNATVDIVVVPDAAVHTLVLETDVGDVEFETDKVGRCRLTLSNPHCNRLELSA